VAPLLGLQQAMDPYFFLGLTRFGSFLLFGVCSDHFFAILGLLEYIHFRWACDLKGIVRNHVLFTFERIELSPNTFATLFIYISSNFR